MKKNDNNDSIQWQTYEEAIIEMNNVKGSNDYRESIKNILENEINSNRFYNELIKKYKNNKFDYYIKMLIKDSSTQIEKLTKIYEKKIKKNFVVINKKMIISNNFYENIRFAIEEEIKAADIAINFFANLSNSYLEKDIQLYIFYKLNQINKLELINKLKY